MKFICLWLAVACVAGCSDLRERLFQPEMRTVCEIMEKRCLFENRGDPGEKCVRITVRRKDDGRSVQSEPVCSGTVETNREVVVPISFPEDPLILCTGADYSKNFRRNCKVKIQEIRAD